MGMNTTKLIGEWSMEGAARDLDGRFRSAQEVRALFAREALAMTKPRTTASFLVKPAGEVTWEALLGDGGDGGGGRF